MKSRTFLVSSMLLLLLTSLTRLGLADEGEKMQCLPSLNLTPAMSIDAAAKLDPQLIMATGLANKAMSATALKPIGERIVILGESLDDLIYPVLIRTDLSDMELAALGARPDSRAGGIVSAVIHDRDLGRLASHPGVKAIEPSYWMNANLDLSIPECRANLVNGGGTGSYTGDGVIYGILDTGVDITHNDFKDASGNTRILYIWDHYYDGNAPSGFSYGTEYTAAMINGGQANSFQDDGGHGTHVAGTSVGDGSSLNPATYRGVAWEADLIAVRNGYCDLFCYGGGEDPTWGPVDTKGSIDGLNYMIQKAQALGHPLVVNQSQGVTMGPHDGTTLLEEAYDNFIDQQNLIICIAAGNDQDSDWHGRYTVSPGGNQIFTINNDTSVGLSGYIVLECWYKAGDQFSWRITSPSGSYGEFNPSTGGNYPGYITSVNDTMYAYTTTSHNVNGQGYIQVWLQNFTNGVQNGTWSLRATAANGLPAGGVVDLYCERNQYPVKVVNGLNLTSIVGMPGTTSGAITVAAYNTKIEWTAHNGTHYALTDYGINETLYGLASFSSHGPRRDGAQKPNIAAPGQMIASAWSAFYSTSEALIVPGGEHILMQGTSMACPHVSGAVALMLEADPALTAAEVKSLLQTHARTDSYTGATPNASWGYGKLDVKATIDAISSDPGACATVLGDANGGGTVDVLDVIATVNHILGTTPLGAGGQACADTDSNSQINILDVIGIVNIILGKSYDAPIAQGQEAELEPVAWAESFQPTSYNLTLDDHRLGGLQVSFILPRGYELAGDPVLHGAMKGTQVDCHERIGQHHLVAYNLSGRLSDTDGPLTLEIPVVQTWNGGQELERFAVTNMVLADTEGRALQLAIDPMPLDPDQGAAPVGLKATLSRTWPNPSKDVTQVRYQIPASGRVKIEIYDTMGRKVRSLWDGWQMAGDHSMAWDSRDDSGHPVAGGLYFVNMMTKDGEQSRKIMVVR
ncbi:MAG: S8 family serine peptidase [Candidatus Eisenbacteria bacterium]|uniref:S8 family serine peptidase n=1 Tax=Eiseniibacteriota bacterium TaxID=2212470 RepID=A0A948RV19_UNCEI|nr:S8 family serine peptidase [Candidatus Eisenbacteria bacterium]MBU1947691.1 S8 family serine peptidase [Candidatus Eisenbacteria bacterium]MBU2689487.1 S8 family serine peptidase [Candidatus Eisenbacteria bacterium]